MALWVLARVAFPDRPPPKNPVQPLLTQLTPRPTFADLASEIAALRPRVAPMIVAGPAGLSGCGSGTMWRLSGWNPKRHDAARNAGSLLAMIPHRACRSCRSNPGPSQTRSSGRQNRSAPGTSSRRRCRLQDCRYGKSTLAGSPRRQPAMARPGVAAPVHVRRGLGFVPLHGRCGRRGLVVDHGDGHVLVLPTVLAEADRLLDRCPPCARTSASTFSG